MNIRSITILLASALAAGGALAQHAGHGAPATPYAGLQSREIKALAPEETRALLAGQGSRLALAAELNGYPGPAHVLEFADALQLTPQQRQSTDALMRAHKSEARALGAQVVEAEQELDRAFAHKTITAAELSRLTARIGELQAQLRAAHLRTHLEQTALLAPRQVAEYQRLRGYTASTPHHQGKH